MRVLVAVLLSVVVAQTCQAAPLETVLVEPLHNLWEWFHDHIVAVLIVSEY